MIFKKHLTFDDYGNPMEIKTTSIFHNAIDTFWNVFYTSKLFLRDTFIPCIDNGRGFLDCDCKKCRPF